jgi:hypothetical protein
MAISAQLKRDIEYTLELLKLARVVNPRHEDPRGKVKFHFGCDVCSAEVKLNFLIDQIPR